ALGLSFVIVIVALPKVLLGFVLVAVKLALVLSAVAVRPRRTRPASAMPAKRLSLRISVSLSLFPLRRFLGLAFLVGRGFASDVNVARPGTACHQRQGGEKVVHWS